MIINYDQIPNLINANLEVRIKNENLNSSKKRNTSIVTSFIPEVSLYALGEESQLHKIAEEPSLGIVANFNLFNGLRDIEKSNIQNLNYNTEKLELKKVYNEQVFLAKKFYFEALKTLENLKILSEHELVNKSNRSQILKKVASGLSPKSEELVFKKIDLDLQEKKIKESNELKIIYNNLRKILALNDAESIEISGAIDIENFDYVSHSKKIDLALAESSEELARSEKKLNGLWRMPRVNFYAERSFTNHINGDFLEKNDSKQVFGLKLVMPLLSEKNSESIQDQVQEIQLERERLKKKREMVDIEFNEKKIIMSLEHLKNIIQLSEEKVAISKEIMERTFLEFKLGLKEALSLNEAAENYLNARKDLTEHKLEYILSVEEAKVGQLE